MKKHDSLRFHYNPKELLPMGNEENIVGYSVSQSRSAGSLLDSCIHECDTLGADEAGIEVLTVYTRLNCQSYLFLRKKYEEFKTDFLVFVNLFSIEKFGCMT